MISNAKKARPNKPYPEFPLYAHATGRWCRKIRGKHHYFGPWDDPHGALQRYLSQHDDLHTGREPSELAPAPDAATVADLCNHYLNHQLTRAAAGEIRQVTFDQLHATCKGLVELFGRNTLVASLAPDYFSRLRARISKTRRAVATLNEMQRVRGVFRYGFDQGLISALPRYGQSFRRPTRREIRQQRNERGPLMFSADEINRMLEATQGPLNAMLWLGINCGFGNADVGTLTVDAIDLPAGWNTHPRPKTGVRRRIPLWPETVAALEEALAKRPTPHREEHAGLCFVTKYGHSFYKDRTGNPISAETRKLLKTLNIHRPGLAFYSLRRTFETVAGDCKDQVAVDAIMGHARDDMATVYRQAIFEQRLRDVVGHVRAWLLGDRFTPNSAPETPELETSKS